MCVLWLALCLQGVVKQFFNEKEVTSTLVMDALFCGCRQLECCSRKKVCAGSEVSLGLVGTSSSPVT